MSIDEMRKAMQEFCRKSKCPSCPVVVVHGLCEEYDWENAPEDLWASAPKDLIEKAYLLAFGKIKEDNQMNITADEIRKAALELIGKRTQSSAAAPAEATTVESFTYGYILGVGDLTKKVTEGEDND